MKTLFSTKKLIKLLSVALIMTLVFALPVFADVGNVDFGDYDVGGNDGGYDGGDYDYDFGGDSSSSGEDLDLTDILLLFTLFYENPELLPIVAVIGVIMFFRKKKKGAAVKAQTGNAEESRNHVKLMDEATIIAEVTKTDPSFSAEYFKTYAGEVFIQVQEAWQAKDWHIVRPIESDKLFNVHERQLKEYIDNKKTNIMDSQFIAGTELKSFVVNETHEVLTVKLDATLIDYTIDDTTGKVISGSKTQRQSRSYKLEFIRTKGHLTDNSKEMKSHECPSCGAPAEVNSTGRCEYCKNIITSGNYGWVLNQYNRWF